MTPLSSLYDDLAAGDLSFSPNSRLVEQCLPLLSHLLSLVQSTSTQTSVYANSRRNLLNILITNSQVQTVKLCFEDHRISQHPRTKSTDDSLKSPENDPKIVHVESLSEPELIYYFLDELKRLGKQLTDKKDHIGDGPALSSRLLEDYFAPEYDFVLSALSQTHSLESLADYCIGALVLPSSHKVFLRIVLNDIHALPELVNILSSLIVEQETSGQQNASVIQSATEALLELARESKLLALRIRDLLVMRQRLPELILMITVEVLEDESAFLFGLVSRQANASAVSPYWDTDLMLSPLANSTSQGDWIWTHIREGGGSGDENKSAVALILAKHFQTLADGPTTAKSSSDPSFWHAVSKACRTLGLLLCMGKVPLSETECCKLLSGTAGLLSSTTGALEQGLQELCCLVFSTGIVKAEAGHYDNKFHVALDGALRSAFNAKIFCSGMLTIGYLLHSGQAACVNTILSEYIGFHPQHSTEAVSRFGEIIYRSLFTEAVVARELVAQTPVLQLSEKAGSSGSASLLVPVLEYLTDRTFLKYKVDVGPWVLRQLQSSAFPVHPLLPAIVCEYADSCTPSAMLTLSKLPGVAFNQGATATEFLMTPIPERIMLSTFRLVQEYLTPEVAAKLTEETLIAGMHMALFALRYNQSLRGAREEAKNAVKYKLSQMPIALLFSLASSHSAEGEVCQHIYPVFLRLVVDECPSLIHIQKTFSVQRYSASGHSRNHGVDALLENPAINAIFGGEKCRSVSSLIKEAARSSVSAVLVLHHLQSFASAQIIAQALGDVIEHILPLALTSHAANAISEHFGLIWAKSIALHPTPFAVFGSFISKLSEGEHVYSRVTHETLLQDPAIALRVDARVFSTPPLLRVVLQILRVYLVESRNHLDKMAQCAAGTDGFVLSTESSNSNQGVFMDMVTTIVFQETFIANCFVELAHPESVELAGSRIDERQNAEIHFLACEFLDEVFHEFPALLRGILAKGLPVNSIGMLLAGVSALKDTNEYLFDLMQAAVESSEGFRIYAITYLSAYCRQYPHLADKRAAELAFEIIETRGVALLSTLGALDPQDVTFLLKTFPALKLLCDISNSLVIPTVKLLVMLQTSLKFAIDPPGTEISGSRTHSSLASLCDLVERSLREVLSLVFSA